MHQRARCGITIAAVTSLSLDEFERIVDLGAVFDVARGAKWRCTFGPILCNKKAEGIQSCFSAPEVLISAPPGSAMGVIPVLRRRLLGRQACADSGASRPRPRTVERGHCQADAREPPAKSRAEPVPYPMRCGWRAPGSVADKACARSERRPRRGLPLWRTQSSVGRRYPGIPP